MGLSQGGLFVIQFGTSVILARLLTPYEMGIFAIAVAIVGLLAIIRALGLPAYLVRTAEPGEDLLASIFTANAVIATLLAASIAGFSILGAQVLGDPGVRRVLLVMAVVPLLGIFDFLPATMIERSGNFRIVALVNIARSLVANGVALALAFSGFSYMSLAYGQLASALVSIVVFNAIGWQHVRLRVGFADGRNIMRYAVQMVGISGVTIFAMRMSDLVLGRVLGLGALGLYSRASGLSGTLWDSVHMVATRIIFVDFANTKRQGLSLKPSYLKIIQIMTALLWPAFLGLAVIAGPVVQTLYGETWIAAAVPLSLLCLGAAVSVSIAMTWEVFNVSEETARQARIEFIRAGTGLVLFAGGCLVSITAAAAAKVLEALVAVALYRPHLDRMTGTSWSDILPLYGESALLTALAITPAAAVMALYGWSPTAPLPAIAVAASAGVVAWLGGLVAMRHPLYHELRALLPRRSVVR